jgi:redox-sensitive bicupin YhaK (pirin superfamily)
LPLNPARKAYVHVIQGQLQVNGLALQGGDAALIEGESLLTLNQGHNAEVLLFDLSA